MLSATKYGDKTGWDLSLDLWNLLSKRLGISLYKKRVQLANGVEGNGLELWRRLFADYEGGDEFTQLEGRTDLQNFKPITSSANISDRLGDWQHEMLKYGGDITMPTLYTMLMKILPDSVRQDVLKNGVKDVDEIIAWIRKTNVWNRSADLLKKRNGSVSAITGATHAPPPGAGCDAPNTGAAYGPINKDLIDAVIAAVQRRNRRVEERATLADRRLLGPPSPRATAITATSLGMAGLRRAIGLAAPSSLPFSRRMEASYPKATRELLKSTARRTKPNMAVKGSMPSTMRSSSNGLLRMTPRTIAMEQVHMPHLVELCGRKLNIGALAAHFLLLMSAL